MDSKWISFDEFADRLPGTASAIMGRYRISDTRFVKVLVLSRGFLCVAAPCVGGIDPPCRGIIVDLTSLSCIVSIDRYGHDGMNLVMNEIERYTF